MGVKRVVWEKEWRSEKKVYHAVRDLHSSVLLSDHNSQMPDIFAFRSQAGYLAITFME